MPCQPSLIFDMLNQYLISLGNSCIRITCEAPFELEDHLFGFLVENRRIDCNFHISEEAVLPDLPRNDLGEDLLMQYFESDNLRFAAAKPGTEGLLVVTSYTLDLRQVHMQVRKDRPDGLIHSIGKALQLFPMRAFLMEHGALLLHASQVSLDGIGILFTAPSGTGKTTQASLWNKVTGANLICGDRTLLQREETGVYTYGFPVDGSQPVYSNSRNMLGAIVVLMQANENMVSRIRPSRAIKYLMGQTVSDVWDPVQRMRQTEFWINLLGTYPVYLLACRPDEDAVRCLQHQLEKDEVIACL